MVKDFKFCCKKLCNAMRMRVKQHCSDVCHYKNSQVFGAVNHHSCRIWGSKTPHHIAEHVRDSTKVNVRYELMCDQDPGSFCFEEKTWTCWKTLSYLKRKTSAISFLQYDNAPTGFGRMMCKVLHVHFPGRWIGRGESPSHGPHYILT